MLPPFRLRPAFRHGADTPWGGCALHDVFGKQTPDERTGEALEASALPGLESVDDAGETLGSLLARHGEALRGTAVGGHFPLLLKLIDARETLSVQVHPDDAYARTHENGKLGKTEAWVILAAAPGASIVYGMEPGTEMRTLVKAAQKGAAIEEYLRRVYVQPGDVFYIPAGMVHAIGGGILLYEIQQASDITYRFWDWNRWDARGLMRPLHLEQALDVVRPYVWLEPLAGVTFTYEGASRTVFIADRHFALERLSVKKPMRFDTDPARFYLLTALGMGSLCWPDGRLPIEPGDTVFVPATSPNLTIEGDLDLLVTYVPDRARLAARIEPAKQGEVMGLLED